MQVGRTEGLGTGDQKKREGLGTIFLAAERLSFERCLHIMDGTYLQKT